MNGRSIFGLDLFNRDLWWAAAFLVAWGLLKIPIEMRINEEHLHLRHQGNAMTQELRDQLGQGAMIAVLGGFRAITADLLWIQVTTDFERQDWLRLKNRVELAVTLQPRSQLFWDMGAWQMAWNAALNRRNNLDEPNEIRRIKEERYWISQGVKLLERGVENIPEHYKLWMQLAWIHDQRTRDYAAAARYYKEALKRPECPLYVERFAGYALEKAGDWNGAYEWWKGIWFQPGPKNNVQKAWDVVEKKIRLCEDKLDVPDERRVFPKQQRKTQ